MHSLRELTKTATPLRPEGFGLFLASEYPGIWQQAVKTAGDVDKIASAMHGLMHMTKILDKARKVKQVSRPSLVQKMMEHPQRYAGATAITAGVPALWSIRNEVAAPMRQIDETAKEIRDGLVPEMRQVITDGLGKVTDTFTGSGKQLSDIFTGFGTKLNNVLDGLQNPLASQEAFKKFITSPAGAVAGVSALGAGGIGLIALLRRRRAARQQEEKRKLEEQLTRAQLKYYRTGR